MSSLTKTIRILTAALAVLFGGFASTAMAQTSTCGVTGSTSTAPVVYDPFNPSGLASTTITVNLTRVNNSGGGDTRIVNFFLRANAATGSATDGATITPISVAGSAAITGLGLNIFYNYTAAPPIYAPTSAVPSAANRFLKINFTGNNAASNTAQVTFQVSLPANLNINAVQSLAFDAIFACNIQGGQSNGLEQTGSFANAVVFPVTVLSALRTYYAGTALDFGEIGNIPAVPPSPVKTNPANYVFVQSSGAYSVTLSSQNGFKLFKPGAAVDNDKVKYSLRFLGMDVNSTTTPTGGATAITRSCMRAGLTTAGNSLPIQATLQEGGQGKNPSPTYADILTVTVTPLIYSSPGVDSCGTFTL